MNETIYIICILTAQLILIFCGAFFAATETAFTSTSKISARQMLKSNEKNSRKIYRLRNNLDTLISTVLIGTNLVTTLLSSLSTAFSMKIFGSQYVTYGTAITSIMIIIFSEIIPKTYAAAKPKKVAQESATAILIIQKIFFPVVWIFKQFSRFLEFIERSIFKTRQPLITEDELKTLVAVGQHEGTLESEEKNMLDRIFEFSDLQTKDIMRHRSFIKYVQSGASYEETLKAFAESGYSRLPVIEGEPGASEKIIGMLHYKSVLFAIPEIRKSQDFVRICMSNCLFVPESMTAVDLLRTFKKEKENFAIALNEYGETDGIVTMDDILRAVFGRITDEYGETDIAPEKRITVINTNEFLVPGDMKIDDVNDVLNMNLDSEIYNTLGGWLLEHFGYLPSIGEVYKSEGIIFTVEDQASRRIISVRIRMT